MPQAPKVAKQKSLKKHVSTIHAGGDLTVTERKLVNILLLNAFEKIPDESAREFFISQTALCAMLGWDASNNSPALKKALKNIVVAPIEFNLMDDDEDASIDWGAMTLLAQAVLKNGVCKYAYAPELQRKLADPEIFGVINMNVQRQFERTHSLSLYENCARYLKTGSTGFHGVEKWRRLLGTIKYDKDRNALPSTYDSYKVFKSKVLVPAVAEVNRVSNIFVTLHEEKVGRKVERIRFEVSENPQTSFLHESPESDGIRETEGYKALQGIGFDGKLATSVIELMGEQYALNLAAHVKRPGVDNPGGLAFTLFRDRAPVPDRKQQQAAPLPHNKPDEVAKDKQSNEARKASASLTDERRAELRAAYIAAHPGASFNEETGKWNKPAHVTGYRAFERASA